MRIETSLKARDRAVLALQDMLSSATLFGFPNHEIHSSYMAIVADLPKGTPEWVRSHLAGYYKARTDVLYADHLIFGGYVDGVFYSTVSHRPDYYGKHGIEASDYAKRSTERGHYWPAHCPHRGGTYDRGGVKPYFVGE